MAPLAPIIGTSATTFVTAWVIAAATPAANAAWGSTWAEGYQSPLRKSLPRPPLVIEGTRPPLRGQEAKKVGGFAVGDRVFHQKFGYGTIRVVEDNKLEIAFEKAGDKKIGGFVVELKRLADLLHEPVLHDHDPVTQSHRLDLIMGHVNRRGAKPIVQLFELDPHLHAQFGVEV